MLIQQKKATGRFAEYINMLLDQLPDVFQVSMYRNSYDFHYHICFVDKSISAQLFTIKGVSKLVKEINHGNEIERIKATRITFECLGDKPMTIVLDFLTDEKTLHEGTLRMEEGDYGISDAKACSLFDHNIGICFMSAVSDDVPIDMVHYDRVVIRRRYLINDIIKS